MLFMPFQVLGVWLRGLLAIFLIAAGIYLLRDWYERTQVPREVVVRVDPDRRPAVGTARVVERRAPGYHFGANVETALLLGGLALTGLLDSAAVGSSTGRS